MSLSIPGLGTLYAIFKRDIDVKNDRLEYRRELAKELYDNCQEWSRLLVSTFDSAIIRWSDEGRNSAADEIMELVEDFHKINYYSLREDSPIVKLLLSDSRFTEFGEACCEFYKSALDIKRIVYGDIQNRYGEYISCQEVGVEKMVNLWKSEVERMLKTVTYKWMEIKTLEKK